MPDYTQILFKALVQPVTPQPPADASYIGSNPDLKGPIARYGVDFAIAVSDLTLDPASDGTATAISKSHSLRTTEGKPPNMVRMTGKVSLRPSEYAALQKVGLQIHQKIDVPSGYAFLRAGIYDTSSGAAGTLGIPLANATSQAAK